MYISSAFGTIWKFSLSYIYSVLEIYVTELPRVHKRGRGECTTLYSAAKYTALSYDVIIMFLTPKVINSFNLLSSVWLSAYMNSMK